MDKAPNDTTPTTPPNDQPPAAPQPQEQPAATQQPQQFVQQPQQYVVMQQSLKGVGGWLIFWIIAFSLASIGYISAFFLALDGPSYLGDGAKILSLIFAPLLAVGFLASVVLIAMQKKLAKLVIFATLAVSALYNVISLIVGHISGGEVSSRSSYSSYSDYDSGSTGLAPLVAGILISIVVHALIALYFVMARRVKETLIN